MAGKNFKIDPEAGKMFQEAVLKNRVVNKDGSKKRPAKNKAARDNRIDLHGLTLEQAIHKVSSILTGSRQKEKGSVVFVTGKGKHSPGIYSPIASGVENYLADEKQNLNIDYKLGNGFIEVWLKKS